MAGAILFFFLYCLVVQAESESFEQPFNLTDLLPSHVGHLYSLSTASPVSTAIRANPQWRKAIDPAFQLVEHIFEVIAQRRLLSHHDACNVNSYGKLGKGIEKRGLARQFGQINVSCITSLDLDDVPEKTVEAFHGARGVLRTMHSAMFEAVHEFMPSPESDNWTNWTDPGAPFDFEYNNATRLGSQTCLVDFFQAYRRDRRWYLRSGTTNHDPRRFMAKGERHNVYEWIPKDYGKSLVLPQFNFYNKSQLQNATNVIVMWAGPAQVLTFHDLPDPTSGISQAYAQNMVTVDLSADSITPSNVAILALPMAMNFVPVAFLTDMGTIGLVVYILVTDLFSTIPFFIKGIELILSSRPNRPVVTAYYGGDDLVGSLKVVAVSCTGKPEFRNVGIVFVLIAICSSLLGCALEFWAYGVLKRRCIDWPSGTAVPGPFGPVCMNDDISLAGHYARKKGVQAEYLRESEWWEGGLVNNKISP